MKNLIVKICAVVCALISALSLWACTPACACGNFDECTCARGFDGATAFSRYSPSVVEVLSGIKKGSGIIIDEEDGYAVIVTCYHLAESDTTSVSVRFKGEDSFVNDGISLVGFDERHDITIFKIRKASVTPVSLTDYESAEGESVYAIGNSYGNGVGISEGVVSKTCDIIKYESFNYYKPLIRTTAAVVDGNSGGLLVNESGVVGMTVASNATESFSYALPVSLISAIYENAKNGGVRYPSFSISSAEITQNNLFKREISLTLGGEKFVYKDGALTDGENKKYDKINGEGIGKSLTALLCQIIKTESSSLTLSGESGQRTVGA